jgi:hypothetical protein
VTGSGNSTLTDGSKDWLVNQWINYLVAVLTGNGAGQTRLIVSNTKNVLTTSSAWTVNPESGAIYKVYGPFINSVANLNDGAVTSQTASMTLAAQFLFNGSTLDKARTPNVFKNADVSGAGDTTIWTPAAGKKWRLMGGIVTVDGAATLAAAGSEAMIFRDSGVATGIGFRVYIPAAATQTNTVIALNNLGNGLISATANNALQLNLGTVLAAGNIRVSVWGTEE